MDTPKLMSVTPSPLLSAKAFSSVGGSSSSRKGEIRLDVDVSTPVGGDPTTTADAPFQLLGSPADVSQRSVTISFWYPRRRGRDRHESDRDSSTALQPGTPIDIFARKKLGLLINYAAIGFFDGVLPMLASVLFKKDSDEATQLATARQLALLVRVVFAVLSDTVLPASRHRRRVFLLVGWLLALMLCAFLASVAFNSSNAAALGDFLPLLALLPVGHVLASVSADGLMVEYAHREDLRERGCIQMLLLATRSVGQLIGRSAMSTGNAPSDSQRCQGELDCVLGPHYTLSIAAGVALVALVCSAFTTRVPARHRLALQGHAAATTARTKLQHLWTFLQHPTYLAFVVFGFVQAASLAWATPSAEAIATRWVGVSGAVRWISDSVGLSLRMVAALLMMALWRNTHWRLLTLALVAVSTVLTRLPADVVVLLNTSRSQVMFLGLHHVASLAEYLCVLVRQLVAVELAVPTMEATSFALTMSSFDVGTIVGSFASSKVGSMRSEDVPSSGPAAEWLTVACVVLYVVRATVDVGSLSLLPIQKSHVQAQRASGPTRPSFASGVALTMLLLLLVAVAAFDIKALASGTTGVPWTDNAWLSEYH